MTANETKLAAALLDMASDRYSNFGCNDFDLDEIIPDVEERRSLMRRYHEWNGDPEEFDPAGKFKCEMDFALMGLMAAMLRGEIPDASG